MCVLAVPARVMPAEAPGQTLSAFVIPSNGSAGVFVVDVERQNVDGQCKLLIGHDNLRRLAVPGASMLCCVAEDDSASRLEPNARATAFCGTTVRSCVCRQCYAS